MRALLVFSSLLSVACARATPINASLPVGSTSLHIVCRGEGEPAVVLESGLGNDSSVWSAVQASVAPTTRVCAYDRAGLGASSPAPRPHTNERMAEELRTLLLAANLPGPYVLVGHSMGGVNVRLFDAAHPSAVAGMVLVDAMSEGQPARYWTLIAEADMAAFRAGLAGLPEGTDFETLSLGLSKLGKARSLGTKPLVVLSRDVEDAPPGTPAQTVAQLRGAWQHLQRELAQLSTNRAHVVVAGSHHMIQLERPEVVSAAVREVVEAVREQRPVDENAILATLPAR